MPGVIPYLYAMSWRARPPASCRRCLWCRLTLVLGYALLGEVLTWTTGGRRADHGRRWD
ncbi:MAG: hypothetical protein R2838_25915 [Caldilineaceae bacterium]